MSFKSKKDNLPGPAEPAKPTCNRSHIPRLQRSASLRLKSTNLDPVKKNGSSLLQRSHSFSSVNRHDNNGSDDDVSVKSFGSCASFASCDVDNTNKMNGGGSGCCKKYVLHCQRGVAPADEKYLTPTQRKDKQIRQLKAALVRFTRGFEEKTVEVERLSAEVQRLRSGSLSESPLTVLEEDPECKIPESPGLEDSGIMYDLVTQLEKEVHESSKDRRDSYTRETQTDNLKAENSLSSHSSGLSHIYSDNYWPILEDVKRHHSVECQELKERHNDKIENLLQKLSELNAKYFEMRTAYDKSRERSRVLETQVSELKKEMAAQEEWHSQMYLKMYRKGHEAAKFEHADEVLEFAHKAPKRVSVPELLQQLHRAEHQIEELKERNRCELYCRKGASPPKAPNPDRQAEYTLKFLKDAFYYFLTEKDNKGHLKAIESILGFTDAERLKVAKAYRNRSRLNF